MFFDPVKKRAAIPKGELTVIERPKQQIDYCANEQEFRAFLGCTVFFDIECYPDYFLAAFMCQESGKVAVFEQPLDVENLGWLLWACKLITFNGNRYDLPLISYALTGQTNFKAISDQLILEDAKARDLGIEVPNFNHIDLIEVAPLQGSLKKYAARMHAKRLQELPYSPHETLNDEQRSNIRDYCITDLHNTRLLYDELREQLSLREALSAQYRVDLRSKSDAQIAEAVIVSEVQKLTGRFPKRATFNEGQSFRYVAPEFVKFQTEDFKEALATVQTSEFVLNENGSPRCPQLQEVRLRLGSSVYAMGIGGLHSQEKCRALVADDEWGLVDIDVASYYPRLILNAGIQPRGMGAAFSTVYQTIVDRRLQAKKDGNKVEADSLKITANGTFGKLGSSYSAMYSAEGMIQVTLTGQLSILLLIERLHLAGFEVASGNTDGVVVRYLKARKSDLDSVVKAWELDTSLQTEETHYAAIYNRDVNNYIAIKPDRKVKLKGAYSGQSLSKNPEALILSSAVVSFLTEGTPLQTSILQCRDLTRFVIVREVKGGGQLSGTYLGKVVRYYYAKNCRDPITYVGSGNKVPNSDGARECMDLPDEFPSDLDHARYIEYAMQILVDIGHTKSQTYLF